MSTAVGRGVAPDPRWTPLDPGIREDLGVRFPEHPLRNFDAELQTFFRDVIRGQVDLSEAGNAASVRHALKEVVHAYKKDTVESNASSILYDTPEKRCAYVLKHCACFASAVARHFLRLLRSNPSALGPALRRRRVELCCLGGGPGTEAVGVAKVIGAMRETAPRPDTRKLELVVRVLDISGHWKSTVESVVRTLNRSGTFFDREKVEVRFDGILETDLTDVRWEERVRRALGGADLVTMVYFVSAVNGGGTWRRCVPMIKEIAAAVKPGGLLFFLDSAKDLHYAAVGSATCQEKNSGASPELTLVHGPHLQEFHALSGESIRKYVELYGYFFLKSGLLCLTHCFVACAAWIKLDEKVPGPCPCCRGMSGRDWRKLQKSNTRKREVFLQWLERLLLSELDLNFVIDDDLKEPDSSPFPFPFGTQRTLYATKSKQKRIFTSS